MTEKMIEKALGVVCVLGAAVLAMSDGYRAFVTLLGIAFLAVGFGRDIGAYLDRQDKEYRQRTAELGEKGRETSP